MNHDLLRAERRRRGWSQAKLAEILGISTKTVRRWELGRAIPYPYYRKRLSALFGKTTEQLGLSEKKSADPSPVSGHSGF
jgi:transcriptional regulator with XRE-family HTH domain